jgi:hypothetical protein
MGRKVIETRTKSDLFRTEVTRLIGTGDPFPIANAARKIGIGYAFAYGIAKRSGLANKAAHRRPEANAKAIDLVVYATGYDRLSATRIVEARLEGKANPMLRTKPDKAKTPVKTPVEA